MFCAKIHFAKIGFKSIDYIGFFGILKGAYGVSEKIGLNRFLGRFNMKNRLERFFSRSRRYGKVDFQQKTLAFEPF